MAPYVSLIHGVDSLKLLQEINKQAAKNNRVIDCLLQVYIAEEESKFGLDEEELYEILNEIQTSLNQQQIHKSTLASVEKRINSKLKIASHHKLMQHH